MTILDKLEKLREYILLLHAQANSGISILHNYPGLDALQLIEELKEELKQIEHE